MAVVQGDAFKLDDQGRTLEERLAAGVKTFEGTFPGPRMVLGSISGGDEPAKELFRNSIVAWEMGRGREVQMTDRGTWTVSQKADCCLLSLFHEQILRR